VTTQVAARKKVKNKKAPKHSNQDSSNQPGGVSIKKKTAEGVLQTKAQIKRENIRPGRGYGKVKNVGEAKWPNCPRKGGKKEKRTGVEIAERGRWGGESRDPGIRARNIK